MRQNVDTLVGAQAGSEGKGLIAAKIADEYNVHVRTGGPNAGHTIYHNGEKFVARSVPCGWINPQATLVIGPGAMLDVEVLLEEIEQIKAIGGSVEGRLCIHQNATVITHHQHSFEGGVGGRAHSKIGSTGEGVGVARMARINRNSIHDDPVFDHVNAAQVSELEQYIGEYEYDSRDDILLEGTQGSMLSLVHGPWPYCTSADTNSAQLLVDSGMPPGAFRRCLLVARTYPIRVAGNSGPLPLETTWESVGKPVERTTVTKKVRRVGVWTDEWVAKAIRLNQPVSLCVTFADYLHPDAAGATTMAELPDEVIDWLSGVSSRLEVPLDLIGTGPDTVVEWDTQWSRS
jgi:adenylosuccinate synthase